MDFNKMDIGTSKMAIERLIETEAGLFKGHDGQVYAELGSFEGINIVSVDAARFQQWLTERCIEKCLPLKGAAIKAAIASIKVKQSSQPVPVSVRVGARSRNSEIYWDLSDNTGMAVKFTANGWSIVDHPKVLFPAHHFREPLGEPERDGSIHGLRERFGLSKYNESLIIAFCLACLKGSGPYPILLIAGPDGSGKTTLASYLRMLIDPSTPKLRNLPKKEEELAASARDNHLLAYDDVQAVPQWLEKAICMVSKGTTFSACRRGCEQVLFEGARPVILVGDDEMLLNRELASRALVVHLDPRTEFNSVVGNDYKGLAQMRGALLDIACHGLARVNDLKIPNVIRDQDFERWIAACEFPRWGLEAFQAAYEANVSDGLADRLELDPFLVAFHKFMMKAKSFRGTAGQLLQELNAAESIAKGHRWPQNPRALSGRLRRDAKLLAEIEMVFDIKEGRNRHRLMVAQVKMAPEPPENVGRPAKEGPQGRASRRKAAPAIAREAELPLFG